MRRVTPVVRVLAVVLLALIPASIADAQGRPLRILLTNDDGFESPALRVMRDTLIAAGHQVTVSAPVENFSGAGASLTSGVLKVEDHGERIFAVHGTPADSALVGIFFVMKDTPPDLVVSGTNRGQNLGASTNSSGTVGAAITAAAYGVPAIAVSAGIGAGDLAAQAYRLAADVTRQVIAALDSSRSADGRLLPPRFVININQPALAAERLRGIKVAPLSNKGSFTRNYRATENPGEVRASLSATPAGDEQDTDLALFAAGYTTITVLDGDTSVNASGAAAPILSRIAKVALPAR
jgi:5'/3'-nucleotidase SurE